MVNTLLVVVEMGETAGGVSELERGKATIFVCCRCFGIGVFDVQLK
jgi:hypothetical protein